MTLDLALLLVRLKLLNQSNRKYDSLLIHISLDNKALNLFTVSFVGVVFFVFTLLSILTVCCQ